ncbi:MAG: hypothetical protein A2V65_12700 [Deltaproteobacteria bacterium RBG_13_49_15]|nr:MAG: hypothetical protein A2V65_12700 [Deltaproteobacteria bacterium RBG_13_49_15]
MIYSRTGKIDEDFYVLGHPAVPIYLMDGLQPIIFDAGFTILGEHYISEIEKILGSRSPAYCCITHVHFDHCGSIAALKRRYPRMLIAASEKAVEILKRPNAVDLIRHLNASAEPLVKQLGISYTSEARFEPFFIDHRVKEGDRLEISSDCHVEVFETPGHTWDCLSYRISKRNILLSSEAAGQPDKTGYVVTDCLADFNHYLASLLRFKTLEADLLCPGHIYVYKGRDVTDYLAKAEIACFDFHKTVLQIAAEENGDFDCIKQRIKRFEYDPNPGPKQPEPAYLLNLEARIRAILNTGRNTLNGYDHQA